MTIRISIIFVCCISLFGACYTDEPSLPTLPEGTAMFMCVDGGDNNAGLWILDANTLELLDSFNTGSFPPQSAVISPDGDEWYSAWSLRQGVLGYESRLFAVGLYSKNIRKTEQISHRAIVADKEKRFLVGYGEEAPVEIFERPSLALTRTVSLPRIYTAFSSPTLPTLYMVASENAAKPGSVFVYDLASFSVVNVIPVVDTTRFIDPAAVAVSPDDKYLFLSAFNWVGGGGYNSFFMVDLTTGNTVTEQACGAFAQLSVTPDGKYVYISDPAGYLYQMNRTETILRFNVANRRMETFVNLRHDLGLEGSVFISDKMLIASDNRTMFVSVDGDISYGGESPIHLMKVDMNSKKIAGVFSLPKNSQGYITNRIVSLTIDTYSKSTGR